LQAAATRAHLPSLISAFFRGIFFRGCADFSFKKQLRVALTNCDFYCGKYGPGTTSTLCLVAACNAALSRQAGKIFAEGILRVRTLAHTPTFDPGAPAAIYELSTNGSGQARKVFDRNKGNKR